MDTMEISWKSPGESLAGVILSFAGGLVTDMDQIELETARRIHDIRVGTKKIRALMRLGTEAISDRRKDEAAGRLRDIRGAFAGSRDEEVMRERLGGLFPGEAEGPATELGLAAPADGAVPHTAMARQRAEGLVSLLGRVKFARVTRFGLARNVAHSYRRARKLMRECHEKPEDDFLMHEWRKRTKDICYHAIALAAVKPMRKLSAPLDALAESLGEYHDLSVLGQRADGHESILSVVNERKNLVRQNCFDAAEEIFRAKPSELEKKLLSKFIK